MQYYRCKCGKSERWDSGYGVQPCEGCEECNTTYAQNPSDHKPLEPHDLRPHFLGGSEPNPVHICKRCNHVIRPERPKADPASAPP